MWEWTDNIAGRDQAASGNYENGAEDSRARRGR